MIVLIIYWNNLALLDFMFLFIQEYNASGIEQKFIKNCWACLQCSSLYKLE